MSSKMGKNKNCLLVSASVLAVLTIFFGLLGAILVVATAPRSNQGDSNYRPAAMPAGRVPLPKARAAASSPSSCSSSPGSSRLQR
ncbi:hypothetical protein ZWY2020_051779 [Hordeum vulgare]|nr:hypothetical protein ZWY2020_051779 [Hordeum vulgare]